MKNVFLQLNAATIKKYRVPVESAKDLRYAAADLWESITPADTCRASTLWLDLVHEAGTALTEDEREAFFDSAAGDLELAFGRVCPTATIEIEAEEDKIRDIVAGVTVPEGVGVHLYRGQISVEAEAHFVSYPNRHLNKFSQYEGVDYDAIDACSDKMKAVNETANAIIAALEAAGVEVDEDGVFLADAESIDIYRQQSGGDYFFVNLYELKHDSIMFDNP
jgi:cell division FtsZ-interacting protein ZapD